MRIPKQEDFAILFMSELTKYHGKRIVPISEVARNHGISLLFLKKLARHLRHAGLVYSKEGATGGYTLAKDPHVISIWDIIQAFNDHSQVIPHEIARRAHCPIYAPCLPQTIRSTIQNALTKSLSSISLCDIVTTNPDVYSKREG